MREPQHDASRTPVVRVAESGHAAARPSATPTPTFRHSDPTLREILASLYEQRWLVVTVASAVLALAVLYYLLAKPVFASRAVVQVDAPHKTIAGLEALSEVFSEARAADTEIAILRSQVILGSVVGQLGLDIEAAPARSIVDRLTGRTRGQIKVRDLVVPDALVDQNLVLTAEEGGRFRVAGEDGTELVLGEVGRSAIGPAVQGDVPVEIVVAELVAPPGSKFVIRRRDRGDVVDWLREELRIAEVGKATGVIEVALEGGDPQKVAATVNALTSAYLRQSVERKSAEAESTLEFLQSQLPLLKSNVERTEAALERFQTAKGTVALSRQTESMLERTVDVERELSQLELQRTELRQRFTESHPSVGAMSQKIDQLRAKRALVDQGMREIPAAEMESARLTRDHKVASQLYDLLLNKAQELRIVRSGIVGDVRILDQARVPRKPAWPRGPAILVLGLVLGLGAGVAAALVRRALDHAAVDPDEIEARVGVPVYVTIPHSPKQAALAAQRRAGAPLALADPGDVAVESLRSLRTALQFALVESRNNVIAIGSPSPGVGKSFISMNLGLLLATAGRKVLLVDADLRRGRLHRSFSMQRDPGLSEVLTGAIPLETAVRRTDTDNLDLLSTGSIPPNPSELLATERFQQVMDLLAPRYDFVILDTPPVLAVTDSTVVARCAGVNLLVLRSGQHPYREIIAAVKQFNHAGFPVQGAILNDARATKRGYGRYGRYYEYRSEEA